MLRALEIFQLMDIRDSAVRLGCCFPPRSFPCLTPQVLPSLQLSPPNIATDLSGGNLSLLPPWVLLGSLTLPHLSLSPRAVDAASPLQIPDRHPPSRTCYHPIYQSNSCAHHDARACTGRRDFPSLCSAFRRITSRRTPVLT